MIDTLNEYSEILEQALQTSEPLSLRAHVLTTMIRLVERGKRVIEDSEAGAPGFRMLANILEVRDIARGEQTWVDSLMKDETPSQDVIDLLHYYKARQAVLETTSAMAMAYVGSDREGEGDGLWWTNRAGAVLAETVALAPELMGLPSDRVA